MTGVFLFIRKKGYNQAVEKKLTTREELELEAREFTNRLTSGASATLITLSGELGAGKTTFTQAVAKALGVSESVTSPTFVLEKTYDLPAGGTFRKLVHIDAYRLKLPSELHALGFFSRMEDPSNLILLEWPERVASKLPPATVAITLMVNDDTSRTIIYG